MSTSKWSEGWVPGEPVPALKFNELIGQITDWVEYLQVASPTEGVWTVINSGTTYGALGYSTTSGSWLTLTSANGRSGVQIVASSATAAHIVRQVMTPGASPRWKVTYDPAGSDTTMIDVGPLGLIGPTAVASASTGIRYGYPAASKQQQYHAVGPDIGGYMPLVTSVGANRPEAYDPGTGYVRVANSGSGGAVDCKLRRPLAIPEIIGQLSGTPVLVEAAAAFSGAADDLEIRICRKELATGTITVLTTLKSSDASNTIAHTCLPGSNEYFVDAVGIGVAGGAVSTDGVRNVILVIDFQDVHSGA